MCQINPTTTPPETTYLVNILQDSGAGRRSPILDLLTSLQDVMESWNVIKTIWMGEGTMDSVHLSLLFWMMEASNFDVTSSCVTRLVALVSFSAMRLGCGLLGPRRAMP